MKKVFYFIAFVTIILTSCTKDINDLNSQAKEEQLFLNHANTEIIKSLSSSFLTRAFIEPDKTSSNAAYLTLYTEALKYIKEQGVIGQELQELLKVKYDYRVIVTAIAISENYRINIDDNTLITRSGIGNCVLEAVGINALVKKGGAKVIAKKVLSKFIPYVGWGLAAVDFADCMDWI